MKSFWEHSNCNPSLAGWSLEASCPRVSPADSVSGDMFVFVLLSCLFPRPGRCSLRAPASGPRACAHHHICCRFQWIKALLKMADLCYSSLYRWAIGVSQHADPKIWIVSFVRLFSRHFKYYETNIGDRHILEGVKISVIIYGGWGSPLPSPLGPWWLEVAIPKKAQSPRNRRPECSRHGRLSRLWRFQLS